ncbi:MAG: spore coat protein [Christensenellales bacterium]|jgi:spore coat protein CotF
MTQLTTQEILQDLLNCEKFMLTMYKQFTIEASNKTLKSLLIENMEEVFALQYKIFKLMNDRNFYPTEEAESKKIQQAIKTLRENTKKYDENF